MIETAKTDYHAVSCSGGKDSTALVIGMWERGMHVDEVIGCNEGYWWEEAVDVFHKVGEITGFKMTMLEPDALHSFDYLMYEKPIEKGPNKGRKGYGWPNMMKRWCTTFCKARVIDAYLAKLKETHRIIQYIGIAADEAKRTEKFAGVDREIVKLYPLVDWGMTESDCLNYCYEHGIDWGGALQPLQPHELLAVPSPVSQRFAQPLSQLPREVGRAEANGRESVQQMED